MDSRRCVFNLNKYFMTNIYARAFSRQRTKQQSLFIFYLVISVSVAKTILYFYLDELVEIIVWET